MVKIVKTPGTCSGHARLEGRRIKVSDVVSCVRDWGWSKGKVARELGITPEQVKAALEYYEAHAEEIEAEVAETNRIAEEYERQTPSLLKAKLRAARSATA